MVKREVTYALRLGRRASWTTQWKIARILNSWPALLSVAMVKDHDHYQKLHGEGRFANHKVLGHSISLSEVRAGTQIRTGTWRQRPWTNAAFWTSPCGLLSPSCLYNLRICVQGRCPSHQSLMKKMSHSVVCWPRWWRHFLSWDFFLPYDPGLKSS